MFTKNQEGVVVGNTCGFVLPYDVLLDGEDKPRCYSPTDLTVVEPSTGVKADELKVSMKPSTHRLKTTFTGLNAAIARLQGWHTLQRSRTYPGRFEGFRPVDGLHDLVPDYTEIAMAWMLLDEIRDAFGTNWYMESCKDLRRPGWYCFFIWRGMGHAFRGDAPTAALAIMVAYFQWKTGRGVELV